MFWFVIELLLLVIVQCILTYPNSFVQAKIYYREFYYNMNIIKMYMNNVIILILAVRICEDSDTRGSDKRGYTVCSSRLS